MCFNSIGLNPYMFIFLVITELYPNNTENNFLIKEINQIGKQPLLNGRVSGHIDGLRLV